MADSATEKKMARSGASFARRYGLAFFSVTGALLLELLFHLCLPKISSRSNSHRINNIPGRSSVVV